MELYDQNQKVYAAYELVEPKYVGTQSPPGLCIRPVSPDYDVINALEVKNLHLRFLRSDPTPQHCLAFAREFGLLLTRGERVAVFDRDRGPFDAGAERVDDWVKAWGVLKLATRALSASASLGQAGEAESRVTWKPGLAVYGDQGDNLPTRVFPIDAGHWVWPHVVDERKGEAARVIARYVAQSLVNEALRAHTAAQLLGQGTDPRRQLRLHVRPLSLLGALWLHLARTLDNWTKVQVCEHCGNVFEAQRGSAKYCPEELGTWCRKYARRSARRQRPTTVQQ